VRSVFSSNETIEKGLKKFTLELVTAQTEKLGWEQKDDEDFLTSQLRSSLINAAGGAGHEATIAEVQKRFKLYTSGDKKAVHPSLRRQVFGIAVANGGKAEYDAVKHEYVNSTSVDGKEIALVSLGRVKDPALVKDLLDWNFSTAVATQDKHSAAIALAANSKARLVLWHYIRDNWDEIYKQLSANMVVLDRFVRMSLLKFADHGVEKEIADFFEHKDKNGYDRAVGIIADTIKGNANYKERDEKLVLEWLTAHGYA
jgi:aminopeptidase N